MADLKSKFQFEEEVIQKLIDRRLELGMTKKQLGVAAGWQSDGTVHRLENPNNTSGMLLYTFYRLCKALNCKSEDILGF